MFQKAKLFSLAAKREKKKLFSSGRNLNNFPQNKVTEPSLIIMLANSCAAAATGIHTQSSALVTSKIRARKTPTLIRSRVLSNAIAGKPVPPEVRKKIAHLCFTLIFFISDGGFDKAMHFIFSRVSHSRRFFFLFFVFFLVVSLCDSQTDDCSHFLPLQFFSLSFSIILILLIKIGSTFAVFVRNRTRPSRVRHGKVANARQNSNVRRRGLFSDRHWGCFG